jgi:hypothetical protein
LVDDLPVYINVLFQNISQSEWLQIPNSDARLIGLLWKNGALSDLGMGSGIGRAGKIEIVREPLGNIKGDPSGPYFRFVRWRLPVILNGDYSKIFKYVSDGRLFGHRFIFGISEALGFKVNVAWSEAGAQRSPFLIISSDPLFSGENGSRSGSQQGQKQEYKIGILKRVFFIVIGAMLGGVGIWLCLFTAQEKGIRWLLIGCLMILCGWLIIVLHELSEDASASFGFSGASAATYGRAEDVGVVPIVVPELEFRNVQQYLRLTL